jgi:hypothetical protein
LLKSKIDNTINEISIKQNEEKEILADIKGNTINQSDNNIPKSTNPLYKKLEEIGKEINVKLIELNKLKDLMNFSFDSLFSIRKDRVIGIVYTQNIQ